MSSGLYYQSRNGFCLFGQRTKFQEKGYVHMTLGEKIKSLREKKGITQEHLAEELQVSRSAIAKWESDNGMPDIDNLKRISNYFDVSIDTLVDNEQNFTGSNEKKQVIDNCPAYVGSYFDIELLGWNDGVYDVLILGEDEDFYYYQYAGKEKITHGIIGKKYVTAIRPAKKTDAPVNQTPSIHRAFFCEKPVLLEIACREGFLKGFFDFRNDDYQNVLIRAFSETEVLLEYGGKINIADICKIEEL